MKARLGYFDQDSLNAMNFWNVALAAKNKGNYQECVHQALKGVRSTPTPWVATRYLLFCLATHTIRQNLQQLDRKSRKLLKDAFFKNEAEPAVFRAEAGFTLATLKEKEGDVQRASDYLQEALEISSGTTNEEQSRTFWYGAKPVTCGELLECKEAALELNLKRVQGNGATEEDLEKFNELNSRIGLKTHKTPVRFFRNDAEKSMEKRISLVGGKRCDCCNKSSDDVGIKEFQCCSRCSMAYYCSKECQKKQWRDGHKEHCRKRGQIELDDVMVLRHLEQQSDLNGKLVRVLSKAPAPAGRWQAELLSDRRVISVSSRNLNRIRPDK